MYLMHEVPQSNLLNPAVQLRCRWFVGIPGLSTTHIAYSNTAFTYRDLAGAGTWNLEGLFDQMHRVDLYAVEALLNPISIGYRHKSLYFTFNVLEKIEAYQTVPKDLAEIGLHGNGPFVGETARFDALRSAVSYHREYSLGVSRVFDQYWTAGVRAKLLFGKANLYSGRSDMSFETTRNNFDLFLEGDYTLNSSFPATISQDANGFINGVTIEDINYLNFLLNRGNPGVALDFGLIYRYDEKITLSASLLDVGFMRWRTNLNNVRGTGAFSFEGVGPGDDVVSFAFLNDMADSLINSIEMTVSQSPYSSYQPAQLYLGGSYQIKEHISLGAVSRNVIYRSKLHSSLTLSAQADLANRFLAAISWSYLNNSLKNLGAGIAYHGNGFQFHILTENLPGFFYPFNTRTINLRAGINVMFGCPRTKKEQMEGESYGRMPRGGDCSWTGKIKNRKKLLKKASRNQTRM